MQANVSEVTGLLASIVTLAVIAVIVARGDKAAKIVTASGNAFASSIRAATAGGR